PPGAHRSWPAQPHSHQPAADDRGVRQQPPDAVFWKQRQCPRPPRAILQTLDRPPPRHFLRIVDLAQIQHVPLHHAPAGDPRILDNAPVAMLFAILRRTLQRKNMMAANYRHIGGAENRLGRHYSRFSAFWPPAAFAGQSLALRKIVERKVESAKSG